MGLFDQFKQALTKDKIKQGLSGTLQAAQEGLRNPQGAAADASAVSDHAQDLRRIREQGRPGRCVLRGLRETGEAPVGGNDWRIVDAEIHLPGQEPYLASMRQMVPRISTDGYRPGTAYPVAVDPADPQRFAFTGPAEA